MQSTFKNLLYVLRHYKLATVTNLLGLSFAFLLFMLISIHVGHEYSFDASLLNRERIFQLENKRDDGIWEANFARPQLERFIAASPYIEAAAITNNLVYSSVRFGISASEGPDARSYMEQVERITPGYTKVFGFELVAGDTDCLKRPEGTLIPESMARKLFGEENPIGKPVYLSEFAGAEGSIIYGLSFAGIYRGRRLSRFPGKHPGEECPVYPDHGERDDGKLAYRPLLLLSADVDAGIRLCHYRDLYGR